MNDLDIDIDLGSAEDGQALVWDNSSNTWEPGASGDSGFKIQGAGTTADDIKIKGGLLRHNGTYFITDNGSDDVWKSGVGVDIEYEIGATEIDGTAKGNSTNYWLYIDNSDLSDVVVEYSAGNDTLFTAKGVTATDFAYSNEAPESGNINLTRYIPIGYFRTDGSGDLDTTANSFGEVIPRVVDSYWSGLGAKVVEEQYTTTGAKTYTHGQGAKPTSIELTYYDGSDTTPLTLETYITEITTKDIDLDLTGLSFGCGEIVYLKMIWQSETIALPSNEYDSGWITGTGTTVFTHGLGVLPRSVTLQYDNAGTYEYKDIYSFLTSYTTTQLTIDWTGLTVDATHKARIFASAFAHPTGIDKSLLNLDVATKSSNYTITDDDNIGFIIASGATTITIPAPGNNIG